MFPRAAGLPAVACLDCGSQLKEYKKYFEDWNRAPNAEIGSKDIFEIASNKALEVHRRNVYRNCSGSMPRTIRI